MVKEATQASLHEHEKCMMLNEEFKSALFSLTIHVLYLNEVFKSSLFILTIYVL